MLTDSIMLDLMRTFWLMNEPVQLSDDGMTCLLAVDKALSMRLVLLLP